MICFEELRMAVGKGDASNASMISGGGFLYPCWAEVTTHVSNTVVAVSLASGRNLSLERISILKDSFSVIASGWETRLRSLAGLITRESQTLRDASGEVNPICGSHRV